MNLGAARIVLRARSLAETFDLAMRWQVSVHGTYLRLAAVLLVPCWLVCLTARFGLEWEWPAVWMLACALALVVQGPYTIAASRLMFTPEVSVASLLGQFARRLPAYLVAMVLSRALVAVAGITVVLAPLAWTPVAFVPEAVLLEGQGVGSGLKRASQFNRGQTGTVFGLAAGLSAVLLAAIVAADQVGFVMLDVILQVGRPFESLWEDGGSATALLGLFCAVPYLTTTRFLQYIDGRTRRDGWDIQLAFLAISMAEDADNEEAA